MGAAVSKHRADETTDDVTAGEAAAGQTSAEPGAAGRPVLRIVSGDPTPEEIAALTVVLAAAQSGPGEDEAASQAGGWADPGLRLRRRMPVGPVRRGAWQASAWY